MNRTALVSVVLCVASHACGGSTSESPTALQKEAFRQESSTPVEKTGVGEVTASVGKAGGKLELSNGIRLEIPAGTLQEPTDVLIKVAPLTTVFKNVEFEKTVGPLVLVNPELFAPEGKALIVSIPFAAFPEDYDENNLYLATEEIGTEQRAFGENSTVTRWEYRKVTLENGRATAALEALSGMRLQFVLSK